MRDHFRERQRRRGGFAVEITFDKVHFRRETAQPVVRFTVGEVA
jgi:hypothetical protein